MHKPIKRFLILVLPIFIIAYVSFYVFLPTKNCHSVSPKLFTGFATGVEKINISLSNYKMDDKRANQWVRSDSDDVFFNMLRVALVDSMPESNSCTVPPIEKISDQATKFVGLWPSGDTEKAGVLTYFVKIYEVENFYVFDVNAYRSDLGFLGIERLLHPGLYHQRLLVRHRVSIVPKSLSFDEIIGRIKFSVLNDFDLGPAATRAAG